MDRRLTGARRACVAAAACACGGCAEVGLEVSNQVAKLWAPPRPVVIACDEEVFYANDVAPDCPLPAAGSGEAAALAVLVLPPAFDPWRFEVRDVDGQSLTARCADPVRLGLPAGRHVVAALLSSKGGGSVEQGTYLRGTRSFGTVAFPAEGGTLYSLRFCTPPGRKDLVFWVREESSRRCVSEACPP